MNEIVSKIILGTVQFGINYGINNQSGRPAESDVYNILDEAHRSGIGYLDTAEAYGDAVDLIGRYHSQRPHRFGILNKFKSAIPGELRTMVCSSLDNLFIDSFQVYSYHAYQELDEKPYLLRELKVLQKEGLINQVGVSLYTNKEFAAAITNDDIDVIQIPFNVFDNMHKKGALIHEAKRKGKEIHVRSIFLQGLFFMKESAIPEKLRPLQPSLTALQAYCMQHNIDLEELALSYVLFNEHIDKVLIGVDNCGQLTKNLASIHDNKEAFSYVDTINISEEHLLNPINWK